MATFSPGWYPDPDNSLQKRYWDGTRWTDAIQAEVAGADVWQSKLEAQENGPPTYPISR